MLELLAQACGWFYTIAWGIGAWPPIISNIRMKSVQGLSLDFCFFNTFGYVLYGTYYSNLVFNDYIREEYSQRYTLPDDEFPRYPLIKFNDFVFVMHVFMCNLILLSQVYLWNFKKNDNQVVSLTCKIIISSIVVFVVLTGLYIKLTGDTGDNLLGWQYLDLLNVMGYLKICMSVCKNIPQIYYNYNRQSTHGWPIEMVWFDCIGAVLSVTQLVLDVIIVGDLSEIQNNFPKFLLGVEVIISDVIFFLQHYYWFYEKDIQKYGQYGSLFEEEERFVHEHEHDHDHLSLFNGQGNRPKSPCNVNPLDKGELQRLIGE